MILDTRGSSARGPPAPPFDVQRDRRNDTAGSSRGHLRRAGAAAGRRDRRSCARRWERRAGATDASSPWCLESRPASRQPWPAWSRTSTRCRASITDVRPRRSDYVEGHPGVAPAGLHRRDPRATSWRAASTYADYRAGRDRSDRPGSSALYQDRCCAGARAAGTWWSTFRDARWSVLDEIEPVPGATTSP